MIKEIRPVTIAIACLAAFPTIGVGQAVIEGNVQLPKGHYVPVENERYEIVSKAGVLATEPPRAVIYLAGQFPRSGPLPTKTIAQKDLAFLPPLLAIESRNESGISQ